MKNSKYHKNRLIEMNKLLVKARWLYATAIFLIGLFTKIIGVPNVNFSTSLMISLLISVYGINLIYYLYLYKIRKISYLGIRTLTFIQLLVDLLIMTLMVYFAGGLSSRGFMWIIYPIIASAFFYSLAGILIICTIASLLYCSIIILQLYNIIPYFSRYGLEMESYLAHSNEVVATVLFSIVLTYYVLGIFVGILSNKLIKKEKEVIVERDKEKAILDDLTDGLIFINNNKVIELVNQQAEKFLNFKSKDIIGKQVNKINFKKYKNLDLLFNKLYRGSGMLIPVDNTDINLQISTISVRNKEKELIGVVKIIHDISREKFVDKMKSEFIMIAGHQLRTPMSAIKSATSMLLKGSFGKISPKQKEVLNQCYDYDERMIKLVDDLLQVYSVEQGRFYYDFTTINIVDLINKIINKFRVEAINKEKDFTYNIEKDLPELNIDQYKINLVLNSILDNALSYTDRRGKINLTCEKVKDNIIIKVKDNGIGIPRQLQNRIFEKFYRADNAISFLTEGNGLELFVAKNIIENHGGRVWFKSKVNQGSTFYIELPIKRELSKKAKDLTRNYKV